MTIQEFFTPATLDEAVELACNSPCRSHYIAGGTDVLMQLKETPSGAVRLISLKHIPVLSTIYETDHGDVFMGAMASHGRVSTDPLLTRLFPALVQASGLVGSPSIRAMGTIGGNICNASPSADTAPPLLAYDARIEIHSPHGGKTIPIDTFFTGPSQHILGEGEIVKGFWLTPRTGLQGRFEKLGKRKALEIALVNSCIVMLRDEDGVCADIRIALGAVAPTPVRAKRAEHLLKGKHLTGSLITEASETAMQEVHPISDIRSGEAYRLTMVGVLVKKMLSEMTTGPCS